MDKKEIRRGGDPQPWEVLDRRYVLDRKPYMTLREDTVVLPTGSTPPSRV